jgi:pimeloyl-ACP methyl ester carboxylesterase
MNARSVTLFWCLAGLALFVGCGGSPTTITLPSTTGLIGAPLSPANGYTLTTANGSIVTLNTSLIPTAHGASAGYDASAVAQAPAPTWGTVPGVLSVRLASALTLALPSRAAAELVALRLVLKLPPAQLDAIVAAHAPVLAITHADGTVVRIVVAGTFDASAQTVTVDVTAALLQNATAVALSVVTDNPTYTEPPHGPRYWTGTGWSTTGTIDPTKRTLVLLHGIFSSVETAFPCAGQILSAGGYAQGLGYDYDWTEPPRVEGPIIERFLNGLAAQGLGSFDLEAHSYGTLITLYALPALSARVGHVVLLGGPLALRGSPLASSDLMATVLGIIAAIYFENPSLIYHAFETGMVASLEPNSPQLQTIERDLARLPSPPPLIEVAGTKEYAEEGYFPFSLYVDLPWDGVVERIAAAETDLPNATATSFPFVHTDLTCAAPQIIQYVGSRVRP